MDSQEFITVCQLMRAHGVKGYIKAMPLTHDLTRCKSLKDVRVQKRNGEVLELTLEEAKQANNLWLLKFKGFDTPEALSPLVNGDVMIPESERLPLPEGEYYLDDLEGFRVHTEDGRDVGEVIEVQELMTVDAFLIKFDLAVQSEFSSKSILAPWIDDCVLDIDEDGEFIVCDAAYLKALCPEDHSSEARPENSGEQDARGNGEA